MKKISWISDVAFIDTDLPIISKLQKYFLIKYIFVVPQWNTIKNENRVKEMLGEDTNVCVEFVYLKQRHRSLKNLNQYYGIIQSAKSFSPDLYYISFMGMPYAIPLYKLLLPNQKCVVPCHNVSTPKGATNERIAPFLTDLWVKSFKNFHILSQSQYEIFQTKYKGKNVFVAPFLLMKYGIPQSIVEKKNPSVVKFLFFGNIVKYKRVDLIIEAVNSLVERGVSNFNVTIAGNCKEWNLYQKLIKYPSFLELQIKRIPDEDIADLFGGNHYFLMPYQDIAQSGAIFISFYYNLPTVISDIKQFREFVKDGETCLTFKSEDANSLADTMQYAIDHYNEVYPSLCKNQSDFVKEHFSDEAIVRKYIDFFNRI